MVFTKSVYLAIVLMIFALHVLGHYELSADQVQCYSTAKPECSGAPDLETSGEDPRECCLRDGYWYRLGPSGECVHCIVFGWLDGTNITLEERTSTYTLLAGFIKGGAVQTFVTAQSLASFRIEIKEGSARQGVNLDFVVPDTTHSLFGQDPNPFNVPVIIRLDGIALEPVEEFALSLEPVNPVARAILAEAGLIALPDISVMIRDLENLVRIEQEAYTISEADGSVEVCAILVGGIGPTRVTLTTLDGGAAASKDYSSKAEDLVLDSVITRSCVVIPIVNDIVPEFPEDFTVRLTINDSHADTATEVATVTISDNDEPEEGCSIEVLVLTTAQERNQKVVVEDIVTVLPSIFKDTTDSEITEPTSGEELFASVYSSLAKDFGRVKSDTGYTKFVEAVTEITEAHQEACSGPLDERPSPEDIPGLAERFARLPLSEGQELRKIFGEMLCIKNKVHSNRTKRSHCAGVVCPGAGFGAVVDVCQFFACLNEKRYVMDLGAIFGFYNVPAFFPCLAFVVDTSGSMDEEIDAVKNLVLEFVSSERDEPSCYVITPFNNFNFPPILGSDYGPASVYLTNILADLIKMTDDVAALTAGGGGRSCGEYGIRGIRETLSSRHPNPNLNIEAMLEGSQMIFITDEPVNENDATLVEAVIADARQRKVCIHLFLSTGGCFGNYGAYETVAMETHGRVVRATPSELSDIIKIFGDFSTSYEGSPCVYQSPTGKKKRTLIAKQCHTFRVSTFTDILKVLIETGQRQATVHKPSHETQKNSETINIIRGYGAYRTVRPEPGEWSVCVESGTLTVSFNNRVLLDLAVAFVRQDESLPGHLTATSVLPPACSTGEVAVVTSRVPDISSAHLNFIRDGSVIGSVPLTLCGGAMVGNATFPQGSVTYQLEGEDVGGNPFQISQKTVEFKPGKYSLTSLSNPIEVDPGESAVFVFKLHNQNSYGSTNFTFTTESTSGVHVVLQQTHTSLKAAESAEISVRVLAGSSPGDNRVTIVASDGCTRITASQTLSIRAPEVRTAAPSACGCENGGICISVTRRGRVFNICQCPSSFGGSRCEIVY